ncbi:PREDICTED: solute carrier organic anion transporter family member 2A1-like [Nicrophorus vespilloides]|uniref:Solute carrier organic anion transporter family member 2A1-like n=1 Tax=Nicrophorus vespilloides TaxID=110193 RepID=A0ABM1MHX3_NICVS|nr:PREDICTED: solute carrier organic anion transporter family member 2A1-like [Nicrophorus vespilloides]
MDFSHKTMIHPTRLMRSDSNANRAFSAPANINTGLEDDFDCGLKVLPCIGEKMGLKKFANVGVFIFLSAMLGLLQAIAFAYFKGTASVWSRQYNFNNEVTDWLIYSCDVFGGAFSLLISYWGNRIHRASWLGALSIFHAISAATLIIPELYHPGTAENPNVTQVALESGFCVKNSHQNQLAIDQDGSMYIALVLICIYQMLQSFTTVSFLTHGITYIDDHIGDLNKSPIIICILLLAYEIGKPIGSYLTWVPIVFNQKLFVSFAWLNVVILMFIVGFFITLFPRKLPCNIIKKAASTILDQTNNSEGSNNIPQIDTGFLATFRRVFINRIVILNAIAATLMSIAITNFSLLSNEFFRTRFVDTSSTRDYRSTLATGMNPGLIMQPITSSVVMMSGFIISKFKPGATYLATWNVAIYILIAMSFGSYGFLNCEEDVFNDYNRLQTYCNNGCNCNTRVFSPVCAGNKTYFSPCWAGCPDKTFTGCSCSNLPISEGSCNAEKCAYIKIFAQSSAVLTDGLLSSGIITHLLITLRAIPETDKALALGLHYTFIKLLPYVPFKIFYNLVKDSLCLTSDNDECHFYRDSFPTVLSSVTLTLMILAAAVALTLVFFVKDLSLYEVPEKEMKPIPLDRIDEQNEGEGDPMMRRGMNSSGGTLYSESDIDRGLRETEF